MLAGVDVEGARGMAERLRAAVGEVDVEGHPVTMSFGVSGSLAGEPFNYAEVFARADAALYEAKRAGATASACAAATSVSARRSRRGVVAASPDVLRPRHGLRRHRQMDRQARQRGHRARRDTPHDRTVARRAGLPPLPADARPRRPARLPDLRDLRRRGRLRGPRARPSTPRSGASGPRSRCWRAASGRSATTLDPVCSGLPSPRRRLEVGVDPAGVAVADRIAPGGTISSIRSRTSSDSSTSAAPIWDSRCSIVRGPMIAAVTAGWRMTNASAMWIRLMPVSSASAPRASAASSLRWLPGRLRS